MTMSEKVNENFHLDKFLTCVNEQCAGYGFSAECQTIQACGKCEPSKRTSCPERLELLGNA